MDNDLDEVKVTVKRIEEPLPEIVVSAARVPWWMWAIGGSLLALLILESRE